MRCRRRRTARGQTVVEYVRGAWCQIRIEELKAHPRLVLESRRYRPLPIGDGTIGGKQDLRNDRAGADLATGLKHDVEWGHVC